MILFILLIIGIFAGLLIGIIPGSFLRKETSVVPLSREEEDNKKAQTRQQMQKLLQGLKNYFNFYYQPACNEGICITGEYDKLELTICGDYYKPELKIEYTLPFNINDYSQAMGEIEETAKSYFLDLEKGSPLRNILSETSAFSITEKECALKLLYTKGIDKIIYIIKEMGYYLKSMERNKGSFKKENIAAPLGR